MEKNNGFSFPPSQNITIRRILKNVPDTRLKSRKRIWKDEPLLSTDYLDLKEACKPKWLMKVKIKPEMK